MTINADREHIIFMKVGLHAGESFEDILARKQREFEKSGRIFWGYGGGTMHPTQKVQPFVKMHIHQGGAGIRLVMQEMNSRHAATNAFATHYSADGATWEPVPKGVQVLGSRYALVLDQIEVGELTDLNLNEYRVGIGPSAGRPAGDYIRGRVDKGCLERVSPDDAAQSGILYEPPKPVAVKYHALLQAPYAVLLRTDGKS